MAVHREIALANAATRIGAIKHRQMFILQAGRAFQRHGTANMDVGLVNVSARESEAGQQIKAEVIELCVRELQHILAEGFAQHELVEHELDVKG